MCIHGKDTSSKSFNLSLHPIQKPQNHKQKSPLDFQKKKKYIKTHNKTKQTKQQKKTLQVLILL